MANGNPKCPTCGAYNCRGHQWPMTPPDRPARNMREEMMDCYQFGTVPAPQPAPDLDALLDSYAAAIDDCTPALLYEPKAEHYEAQDKARAAIVFEFTSLRERATAAEDRVAELEAALRKIEVEDDQPECCGSGNAHDGGCCNQPLYGIDRAKRIATAALNGGTK